MARQREKKNSDLPPHLYRIKDRYGRTRYQFQRVDRTRVLFPLNMPINLIRMHSANYNAKYRNMGSILEKESVKSSPTKGSGSPFNILLNEAIKKVEKEVINEELSDSYLQKYQSTIEKFSKDLGHIYTRSLNLEIVNEFLDEHYGNTSAKNFNNILAHIKKLTSYLADRTYILDDFMRNKKNRRIPSSQQKKTRRQLSMEQFRLIYDESPVYLKVAMMLAFESTHSVNEICRIKHTIKAPKDGVCGIVWNPKKQPIQVDGLDVYGTLYIHRQKSNKLVTSRVAIPVTKGIYEAIELAKTDRLVCPYAVRRRPRSSQRGTAKENDHPFQIASHYLSKQFSKVRDSLGIFDHLPVAQRPTFHEIRGLSAREFANHGYNPRARMAHSSDKSTAIYTESQEPVWNPVQPVHILSLK